MFRRRKPLILNRLITAALWQPTCLRESPKGATLEQDLKLRLARSYAILKLIDKRRAQLGDPGVGWAIEKQILDRELRDLETVAVPASPEGAQQLPG